jgi:hypothetical protein
MAHYLLSTLLNKSEAKAGKLNSLEANPNSSLEWSQMIAFFHHRSSRVFRGGSISINKIVTVHIANLILIFCFQLVLTQP